MCFACVLTIHLSRIWCVCVVRLNMVCMCSETEYALEECSLEGLVVWCYSKWSPEYMSMSIEMNWMINTGLNGLNDFSFRMANIYQYTQITYQSVYPSDEPNFPLKFKVICVCVYQIKVKTYFKVYSIISEIYHSFPMIMTHLSTTCSASFCAR